MPYSHSTYVRGGGTDSFSSFLSFALKRSDFDYHAQVQVWEGLGWEVDVVRYEPGKSIQTVRKYLALPPIPPEYPDKNLSPSPLAVEAIRLSNSILMRFRASKAWQSRLQRFVSFWLRSKWRNPDYVDSEGIIVNQYAEGNSLLARRYFHSSDLFH